MTRLALALAACSSSAPPPAPPAPPAPVIGRLVTSDEWMGTTKQIRATGRDVPLAQLGALAGKLGLPLSGTAAVDLAIDVPNGSATAISGHVDFACTACRIGDDVIAFGHIDITAMTVAVAIANGRADITSWHVSSPDVALEVSGHVELATHVEDSQVTGCVRFKLDPSLERRAPKTFAALSLTGAPLGPDGFFSIVLTGPLGQLKRLGQICP